MDLSLALSRPREREPISLHRSTTEIFVGLRLISKLINAKPLIVHSPCRRVLTGKTNFPTLGRRSSPASRGGLMVIFSRTAIAKSVRRAMLAGILLVSGWDNLSEAFAQDAAEPASAPLILRS